MNEDGKRTTQATTLVLFQRGEFGPASILQVYAEQTKRKRSIESMFLCQSIRQYSAYGKHPAVRVLVSPDGHVMCGPNVTNDCIRKPAWWILLGHW